MKKGLLFLSGLAFLFLMSCSSDNEGTLDNTVKEKAYFSLKLAFPTSSSVSIRSSTPTEGGDGYQDGLAIEQQFQRVVVIVVSATDNKVTDYLEYANTDFAPEGDAAVDGSVINPTSVSKNYLAKAAKLVTKGSAKVYVFLNPNADISVFSVGTDATNLLKKEMTPLTIANITGAGKIANANNFLMGNADPVSAQTIDGTVKNPTIVTVNVERAAVKLVENTPAASLSYTFAYTNPLGLPSKNVTVTLEKYDYNNLEKRSFLLKNVENRTDAGSVAGSYVVDPNFVSTDYNTTTPAITLPWFTNDFFISSNRSVTKTLTQGDITYCLENTMISNEQYVNKTTAIVYQASIKVEGNPAATFYTYKNVIYTSYANLQTAYNLDYPNPVQQLGTFFLEPEVSTAYGSVNYTADVKTLNTKLINKGIRCYYNGVCFYNWMIKHWEQSDNLARMEFGVVRNNVYYLAVKSILNIGEPWIKGGPEDPDPTVPDPDETGKASLVMSINVQPWTVRNNDIEF
jgi:hypothetical protein